MLKIIGLAALLAVTSQVRSARSEETVSLVAGGPAVGSYLKSKKDAVIRNIGTDVEVRVASGPAAFIALSKGLIDGLAISGTVAEALEKVGKGDIKLAPEDFQSCVLMTANVQIGLHPDNPVRELTRQQITDILAGKLTDWKSINGRPDKIHVVIAQKYIFMARVAPRFYLHQESIPVAQLVVDADGLINFIKQDRGAFGLFPGHEEQAGFSPKFLDSEASYPIYLIMRKKSRPAAQKAFDYLRDQGTGPKASR